MKKRKWYYTLPPSAYEVTCTKCGGSHLWWSEYERCVWCYDCEIDFDPGDGPHAGIFSGPIPIQTTYLFGLVFDRFNIETGNIEILNLETNEYEIYNDVAAKMAKATLLNKTKDPYGLYIAEEGRKNIDCKLFTLVDEIRSHYK